MKYLALIVFALGVYASGSFGSFLRHQTLQENMKHSVDTVLSQYPDVGDLENSGGNEFADARSQALIQDQEKCLDIPDEQTHVDFLGFGEGVNIMEQEPEINENLYGFGDGVLINIIEEPREKVFGFGRGEPLDDGSATLQNIDEALGQLKIQKKKFKMRRHKAH